MGRHSLSLCFFEEKDLRMFEMGNVLILSNIWIKNKVAPIANICAKKHKDGTHSCFSLNFQNKKRLSLFSKPTYVRIEICFLTVGLRDVGP